MFIKAQTDGYLNLIINKVLQVPYFVDLDVLCTGPSAVYWQFESHKLGNVMNVVTRTIPSSSSINNDNNAIMTIRNFGRSDRGFYTCSTSDSVYTGNETILITGCKFKEIVYTSYLFHHYNN